MTFPFLQLLFNSLIIGSIYALVAVGFSVIYATNRFMHFAHGAVVITAGYILFTLFMLWKIPFILSIMITIACAAGLGYGVYIWIYAPLLRKKSSTVILLIASVGVLILLENVLLLFFGPQVKAIEITQSQQGWTLFNAIITPLQLLSIGITGIILLFVSWTMYRTSLGQRLRAVADNPELASIMGLDVVRLKGISFLYGSGLAGIAGILIAIEQNLSPTMGTMLMVKGFSGAVIGGILSVPGSIFGSYIVGLAEHFGTWYLPSGYKEAITFGLLFLFLLFRPQGLFGKEKGVKT